VKRYPGGTEASIRSLNATKLVERTLKHTKRLEGYLANVPLRGVGKTEDVVGVCMFLAYPASDFITPVKSCSILTWAYRHRLNCRCIMRTVLNLRTKVRLVIN